MKSKPILFSTPMVQAILEGRKTQTRRVVKGVNDHYYQSLVNHASGKHTFVMNGNYSPEPKGVIEKKCPFGQVGDVLWIRETWQNSDNNVYYHYKADFTEPGKGWKPSIFMPKDAARIWLKITNVRVERLNEISDEDAIKEGIDFEIFNDESDTFIYRNYLKGKDFYSFSEYGWNFGKEIHSAPVASYCSLWEKINGDGSWNANPWVWVIEFERIEKHSEV